ncbi:glutamate--cysteine ligase 2 [Streptomyces roseolus]|uniref:glutamate--cysteine ligase 2 n=1 Tax=Streptomyces roseolus TaxID=67358 RepID=UPI001672689E|nr:glutamate--cysteine ligase [Streptomyces roseolus]GGR55620.1 putative glutamate--cysteine ligase 2 [Streptomyces roseolus]
MRTVGVEEELLLVSERTGEPLAVSSAVLASAALGAEEQEEEVFEKELHQEQVEFATRPVSAMDELEEMIVRCRAEAGRHAERAGARVAALATSPLPVEPSRNLGSRYHWLAEQYGLTVQEQLTCGCHVHVSVESDEEGVAVLDRIRPWLYPLNAISGNSPFWQGRDSGYSSYRSRVWNRWPSAGPVELFGGADRYHEVVREMLATGVLRDQGMIYFDARLSHNYPTVEIRVADVCLEPRTTVLVAALVRGLVETAARSWRAGEPPARMPVGLLRLASWRAARSGLDGPLVDPVTMRERPAEAVLEALVAHTEDALRDTGDLELVRKGIADLLAHGGGARRQRRLHEDGLDLAEVVRACARITTEAP